MDIEAGLDRKAFSSAVDHDLAVYSEVLTIVENSRKSWEKAVIDGFATNFDVGRSKPLRDAIGNGLKTDLKIESFKAHT